MVKRSILLAMFGMFAWTSAFACNACGCSISGNGVGLLQSYRNNFVGIGWQMAHFQSAPEHGSISKDHFQTIEWSLRYHFSPKFKVLVFQPYRINVREFEGQRTSLTGISDTRIIGSYTFLNNTKLAENTQVFFEMGIGAKLPTGKYNADIHEDDLPENFNIGNGSWGAIVQANLVLSHQEMGLALSGFYQHLSPSFSDYQFGHQLSTQALFFVEKNIKNLLLMPNAGLSVEQLTSDTYKNGNTVHGTGGKGYFATAGLTIQLEEWRLGLSYAHPFSQDYAQGEVLATDRLSCQFSYIF